MTRNTNGSALLTEKTLETIEHWLAKFPQDKKRSALIQSLMAAQVQNGGWISPELTEAVAGSNDYVTLTRYDLDSLELALLSDGLLEAELFLPAPGGGGDAIAFDFVRLVVAGQSIPAASTWGLIVLAILVLSAGTLVMMRRKRVAG